MAIKAYRNSNLLGAIHEIVPPLGTTFYSVWHETTGHRAADVPVAAGTTSIKFFFDPSFPNAIWQDADGDRGGIFIFWRNDEEPEIDRFTVPATGGQGTDPGVGGAVTKIVAGSGIAVSPASGTGDVTVTNTAPESGGSGGVAGVSKIIAGTNVTISPATGAGDVTVNAAGGGGGGNTYNITIVGGSLPKPTNFAQLQALWDDAAANKYVQRLAPGTKVDIDQTIVIRQTGHDGSVWGMDGGFAQINWVGAGGQDMFRVEGVNGEPNRGFVCMNFEMYGGGYDRDPAGACLRIHCPDGDGMAYYKPTLQNLYTSYATNGFVFEGAVFEFSHINLHAENMRGDGMVAISVGGAVMSNVFGIAPNMSRNGGAGIRSGWSHNVIMGSFIQNSEAGIVAPEGLRIAAFNNGENTGESLYKYGGNAYGAVIYGSEASTGWMAPNNFGIPSSPMKYLLDGPASILEHDGHIAGYNDADAHAAEIRVRK